ncbi:MAG: penicillin-binding protein activator, partial [Gammaproteobacteria bacterium]|nr:penicillin-binding protein activator [Gammaproteobacteria bacterium]
PLGRQAVNDLLAAAPAELPVLMVGNIPEGKTAPNLYGISLSPEQEARQVAERAFFDGHRQAGILSSESEWGGRVAAAFARQWEFLGGTVVENKTFPRDVSDYSGTVQKLLGLDRSIARERILTLQTGVHLQFTPRRRDDIDFLFLAANAGEARLLVPHLRFFQAHDLALYATARVYSGKPDPATDADLDGIVFGDMDWVLDSAALPMPAPEQAPQFEVEPGAAPEHRQAAPPPATRTAHRRRESRPYYHTDLDRLYALGLESYRLIPELEALRNNQRQRHYGKAVDLSVEADGNILRHLTWARFDQGLPVPLPGTTVGIARPGAVQ